MYTEFLDTNAGLDFGVVSSGNSLKLVGGRFQSNRIYSYDWNYFGSEVRKCFKNENCNECIDNNALINESECQWCNGRCDEFFVACEGGQDCNPQVETTTNPTITAATTSSSIKAQTIAEAPADTTNGSAPNTSSNAGAIIGGIFGGLVFCAVCAVVYIAVYIACLLYTSPSPRDRG